MLIAMFLVSVWLQPSNGSCCSHFQGACFACLMFAANTERFNAGCCSQDWAEAWGSGSGPRKHAEPVPRRQCVHERLWRAHPVLVSKLLIPSSFPPCQILLWCKLLIQSPCRPCQTLLWCKLLILSPYPLCHTLLWCAAGHMGHVGPVT